MLNFFVCLKHDKNNEQQNLCMLVVLKKIKKSILFIQELFHNNIELWTKLTLLDFIC